MATYNDYWYILTMNKDTGLVTGVYTVNGVVQEYTSESDALGILQDLFGEENARLVRDQAVTWSVTAD